MHVNPLIVWRLSQITMIVAHVVHGVLGVAVDELLIGRFGRDKAIDVIFSERFRHLAIVLQFI